MEREVPALEGRLAVLTDWIYFLFLIQMMWFAGVLTGGLVLGLIPSTYAVFAVIRKRLQNKDVKFSRCFWQCYKLFFWQLQAPGLVWILIGVFIYYDIRLLLSYQHIAGFITGSVFVSLLLIYILATILLFPISAHYELSTFNKVRLAVLIAITMPNISIVLTAGTLAFYFAVSSFPILLLFFGLSVPALLYTKFAMRAFEKMDDRDFIRNVKESI
ncbi:YesL family protein [Alteribacillus sp. HJP-4]|uniref:YesL family protein n=1 Tax=Alteribacillus sp. HJP-4 TaxID=2775394 RepID=UPI0035CCE74D